jgi:hypothetical protein
VKADLLCVDVGPLHSAPALHYPAIFDSSDPCHLGDEWNYEDVCGYGHIAALRAARVVADDVEEGDVLNWQNMAVGERLFPLRAATASARPFAWSQTSLPTERQRRGWCDAGRR